MFAMFFQGLTGCYDVTHRLHSSSFWGSYLESYKVIPKRNYFGAYGYLQGLYKGFTEGLQGLATVVGFRV